MISGIVIIAKYRTIRDCFFRVCKSDSRFFARNYFEDIWIKVLFVINIILLIILKLLYLKHIKIFDLQRNNERVTPGSFTAIISNIKGPEEGLKVAKFIETAAPEAVVVKVNFVYNISEFYKILRKWLNIEKRLALLEAKGEKNSLKYNGLIIKRRNLKESYYSLKNQIMYFENFNKLFTGFAFVTFETQNQLNAALSKLRYNLLSFYLKKTKYKIAPAHEPEDIVWENFGLSLGQKMVRRLISTVISLAIIFVSFGIIVAIKHEEKLLTESNASPAFYFFIAFIIAIIVLIINFILRFVLRRLTSWESRTTITSYNTVLTIKVTIVYFSNIALVLLIANLIMLKTNLWGSNGVVGNIFIFQAFSVISNSTYEILNPIYWWKRFLRWHYLRKIRKSYRHNKVLQIELNKAYEGVEFDIAERYYLIFKTMSVVFFFQTVMPYLLLFGIGELTIVYWTQKYVLYKRAKRPKDIDFMFSLQMTRIFDFMIIILAFGYFIFEIIIIKRTSIFSLSVLGLTIFAGVLGEGYSRLPFFDKKTQGSHKRYAEAAKEFATDYDRLNPVTQREAVMEWLSMMKEAENGINSTKKLNSSNHIEINSKMFNTISKYIIHKSFYKIEVDNSKSDIIKQSKSFKKINNELVDIDDLNFYDIGDYILDKQRTLLYKQDLGNQKINKSELNEFKNSDSIIDSQLVLSEYISVSYSDPRIDRIKLNKNKELNHLANIEEENDETYVTSNNFDRYKHLNRSSIKELDHETRDDNVIYYTYSSETYDIINNRRNESGAKNNEDDIDYYHKKINDEDLL